MGEELFTKRIVSDYIFAINLQKDSEPQISTQYQRVSAYSRWQWKEEHFKSLIRHNPSLVIEPCIAAGLTTTEEWYVWGSEVDTGQGKIDVLLISAEEEIAIVEVKIYKRNNRKEIRKALTQALDYLDGLLEKFENNALPTLPTNENGELIVDVDKVKASLREGDVLLIVCSDHIPEGLIRLSKYLFPHDLTKQWQLALVELATYYDEKKDQCLIVPHLRHLVKYEVRQSVKIIFENPGEVKIQSELHAPSYPEPSGSKYKRQTWDEFKFFDKLKNSAPPEIYQLAEKLKELFERDESLSIGWGTGKRGSMILKRNDSGILELYGDGSIKFRKVKIEEALGELAEEYIEGLRSLLPRQKVEALLKNYMSLGTNGIPPEEVAPRANELYQLIKSILEKAKQQE